MKLTERQRALRDEMWEKYGKSRSWMIPVTANCKLQVSWYFERDFWNWSLHPWHGGIDLGPLLFRLFVFHPDRGECRYGPPRVRRSRLR